MIDWCTWTFPLVLVLPSLCVRVQHGGPAVLMMLSSVLVKRHEPIIYACCRCQFWRLALLPEIWQAADSIRTDPRDAGWGTGHEIWWLMTVDGLDRLDSESFRNAEHCRGMTQRIFDWNHLAISWRFLRHYVNCHGNAIPLQIDSCLRAYLGPAEYAAMEAGDVARPCQDAGAAQIHKWIQMTRCARWTSNCISAMSSMPLESALPVRNDSIHSSMQWKARKAAGQAAQRAKAEAEREQQEARWLYIMQDGWCMRGTLKFQVCDILAGFCIFLLGADMALSCLVSTSCFPGGFRDVSCRSGVLCHRRSCAGPSEQTRMKAGCNTMGSW